MTTDVNESKRDYLAEFTLLSDRQDPPAFVGRGGILQRIAADLDNRLRRWRDGAGDAWRGGTWLVQGAPGAGKTALLEELCKRLLSAMPAVRVLALEPADLREPARVYGTLTGPLFQEEGRWADLKRAALERLPHQVAIGVSGVGSVGLQGVAPEGVMHREDLLRCARRGSKPHPVVLLIDEVQNVSGGRDGAAAGVLQWLHQATGNLPVLPVYGGLAWSEEHLDGLGISRLSDNGHVDTLGLLTEEERAEAVRRFVLDPKYRIRTGGAGDPLIAQWAEQVAKECAGWPQHLHVSLRALAQELLQADVGRELRRAEPARAAAAEKAREAYYKKRLGNARLQGCSPLAGLGVLAVQAGEDAGKPLREATLGTGLQRFAAWAGPEQPDLQLPEGFTGRRFVDDGLIGAGLLHRGEPPAQRLSVPIPSLVTYVQQHADYAPLWAMVREYLTGPMPEGDPHLPGALAPLLPAIAGVDVASATPFKP